MTEFYTVRQLLGVDGDPDDAGLLDQWHHFAETGHAPAPASGYGRALGRANVPEVAAFARLAEVYADIDQALPADRRGQAVRWYFRGMTDANPKSPTFGLFIRPTFHQLRAALQCGANHVGPFVTGGVIELLIVLCRVPAGYAAFRVERWWAERNEGWNRTRLP